MDQPVEVELKTARHSAARARISPERDCLVGSDESLPIVIQGERVLPSHAKFYMRQGNLWLEPLPNAEVLVNGQALAEPAIIRNGDWIALGAAFVQVQLSAPPDPQEDPAGSAIRFNDGGGAQQFITIGRHPSCGLHIDSPLISRDHARLICTADRVQLEDLRSTNGTFVNGRKISRAIALNPGDRLSFATFVFTFTGTSLEPVEHGGRVRVEARGLTKQVLDRNTKAPKNLLSDINLVIDPGEFIVIFGTSGSGKSTLLDALNGRRPATAGQVAYNGVDLYSTFDLFRAAIGYVPQQDIVHRKITIRRALRYTARLRLPPDTTSAEIDAHIERVLQKVGLQEKGDLPVDTPEPLSGGQLKRVNLAVELVANPNILFLDEATSGLDAGTDKKMMRLFADLAADGKTVICVTHSLENIESCHLVALLHQGHLVYYGSPQEAATYFGVQRLSEVYEKLETDEAAVWGGRFRVSAQYQRYVTTRHSDAQAAVNTPQPSGTKTMGAERRKRWFDLASTVTLTRRYADLLLADRLNLLVLILQAPLIALIVGSIFDTQGTLPQRAAAESQIAFVLVLSAIWFGCINSAREIVKELPVYLRERSVNITIPAYLGSKILPLALLCAAQCAAFLAIISLMIDFPGDFISRFVALFAAGMAATGMGLAVSAFVNSNDKAIAILPLLLIPQFILSNAVVSLQGVSETVAKIGVISYWALDAMRSTLSEELLNLRTPDGKAVIALTGDWSSDITMTAALACGFVVIAAVGLKLKDRRL